MKPAYLPLSDDEYIDEVRFVAEETVLTLAVESRWKESTASGNEWRYSVGLHVRDNPPLRVEGNMRYAAARLYPLLASGSVYPGSLRRPVAAVALRKGHEVFRKACCETVLDAAARTPWLILGGDDADPQLPLEIADPRYCFHPGCTAKAEVEYRVRIQGRTGDMRRVFCTRHSTRGDGGLEDCDAHYFRVPLGAPYAAKISL